MKRIFFTFTILLLAISLLFVSCAPYQSVYVDKGDSFSVGFAYCEIELPTDTDEPLYIAGYNSACEIEGVLDLPKAKAVWLDTGNNGILLIGIDCVAVGNGTVEKIRKELKAFCRDSSCVSLNVYATHTHAGIDTLGLWGELAIDGKNSNYMQNLIDAAVGAAKGAYEDRSVGKLYYGSAIPDGLLYDSRAPREFDRTLYQIRFEPDDASKNGVRLLSYPAHAESLRGDNRLLSADFPAALSDNVYDVTGDDVMYMPSAVGGLIMTRELVEPFDAVENMRLTAKILSDSVLSIRNETELSASLAISSEELEMPLDNTYFFFAKFLGILDNDVKRGESETGYILKSELSVLKLGELTFALLPGEIFPELVSGRGLGEGDPEALSNIAERYGAEKLLVIGLCNDELGYIVPPSDFMINEELPYIETVTDSSGENHYEETNSVGINTAKAIATSFERALQRLQEN